MAVIYVCDRCGSQQREPLISIALELMTCLGRPPAFGLLCAPCAEDGKTLVMNLAGEISARLNQWRNQNGPA